MRIYFLNDYNWECGERLPSKGKKIKIKHRDYIRYVESDKCAEPDDLVVIVWEMWRGRNGRGGYRVEREMYKDRARPAQEVRRQHSSLCPSRVNEVEYGKLTTSLCNPTQPVV